MLQVNGNCLLDWRGFPPLAAGLLGAMGGGLLGEVDAESCPGVSSIVPEKSSSYFLCHARTGGYITGELCNKVQGRDLH